MFCGGSGSIPDILGCTFAANAADDGGGVYVTGISLSMDRTIIAFNTEGGAVLCHPTSGGDPHLTCSDLYGNVGGDWTDCVLGQQWGTSNFQLDPVFCNPVEGDFRIDEVSPCAQAGCELVGAGGVGCDNPTGVAEETEEGEETTHPFFMAQNAPNPSNQTTEIRFGMPAPGHVLLTVHDVSGRRVAVLADGHYRAGEFVKMWNGRDGAGREVGSGVYFARIVAGEFTATRKMLLLK